MQTVCDLAIAELVRCETRNAKRRAKRAQAK
jgi:hypothetical protein